MTEETAPPGGWPARPLQEVVDHIIEVFHRPLRRELPQLLELLEATDDDDAVALRELLQAVWSDVESHIDTEEEVVFPWVLALASGDASGTTPRPYAALRHDHGFTHRAMTRLRELTGNFQTPLPAGADGADLTPRLARLERDLRRHQAFEEEVLFARIEALGEEPSGS